MGGVEGVVEEPKGAIEGEEKHSTHAEQARDGQAHLTDHGFLWPMHQLSH